MTVTQSIPIDVLVLNYNGRQLLAECLPSIVEAAAASRHVCRVAVIDNASTDDSLRLLAERFPEVAVIRRPNRGLCSFNDVLAMSEAKVALLLNNDIKLDREAIDPLVEPLLARPAPSRRPCFMTAPLCWKFDGITYEGLKTAITWRWGLIQATARFQGHRAGIHRAGLTASAGAVMAVDRVRFLELGGFDPLYLPGRLEDVDFAYRGYLAGYEARYVPQAVAYHGGLQTFRRVMRPEEIDRLALRNTLLFQWKNLRHPWHVARQCAGVPLRLARDLASAPLVPAERRFAFCRALMAAMKRWRQLRGDDRTEQLPSDQLVHRLGHDLGSRWSQRKGTAGQASSGTRNSSVDGALGRLARWRAERDYFKRFHPAALRVAMPPGGAISPPAKQAAETSRRPHDQTSGGRLAAVIIALDEERHLAELLPRLDWVDEIVVVDGGSRDRTVEVARRFGARVTVRPFDDFASQRNFALSLTTADWVLSLDADERPSPRLSAEIAARMQEKRCAAYRIPIRSRIFGRRVRFSGTQDDRPIRLFRRCHGRWTGGVHEVLQVRGPIGQLRHGLDHHTTPDLRTYLAKLNRYTAIEVQSRLAARRAPKWRELWLSPPLEVLRRLVWKQGLLDGPEGWAFCLLSGFCQWVLARRHRRAWKALPPDSMPQFAANHGETTRRAASRRMTWRFRASAPLAVSPGMPVRRNNHHDVVGLRSVTR